MKIINKTHWNTKSIHKLIAETLKRSNKIEGVFKRRKYLEIEIVYSKKRQGDFSKPEHHFTGNATYNGNHMKLRIPRDKIDSRVFARVFDHELYHLRGWHHNKLGVIGGRFLDVKNLEKDNWALEFSITLNEEEPKPNIEKSKSKIDLQLKKYNHVLTLLKDKKSKLKRLQTQINKWTQKRRYYEHILVANGKLKKGN